MASKGCDAIDAANDDDDDDDDDDTAIPPITRPVSLSINLVSDSSISFVSACSQQVDDGFFATCTVLYSFKASAGPVPPLYPIVHIARVNILFLKLFLRTAWEVMLNPWRPSAITNRSAKASSAL